MGRLGGSREEPRGVDEDVESASHQQFDQKSATSRWTLKPLLIKCNSRRLHSFPRGFAPRTPLHALSLAAAPARSDRVARSRCSLAPWKPAAGFTDGS